MIPQQIGRISGKNIGVSYQNQFYLQLDILLLGDDPLALLDWSLDSVGWLDKRFWCLDSSDWADLTRQSRRTSWTALALDKTTIGRI